MNKDCPGCRQKKNFTDQEIENLIAEQLMFEVDLVSEKARQKRLTICHKCPELLGYTCLKCGCFAKFRASLIHKNCPMEKW